jgi:hypothetical protein
VSYIIVNHVIEYSVEGSPWASWWNQPSTEEQVAGWRKSLPRPQSRERTSFRLVKRTAVITDEVLDEDPKTGTCDSCGLTGVKVIPARLEPFSICADAEACQAEYDRITEDEGWLR